MKKSFDIDGKVLVFLILAGGFYYGFPDEFAKFYATAYQFFGPWLYLILLLIFLLFTLRDPLK